MVASRPSPRDSGDCGPLMSGTSHVPPPDDYRADESGFPDAMASAAVGRYTS